MSFRLRVFLSSTGKDLSEHRRSIIRHLDGAADRFFLDCSERFGAKTKGVPTLCRDRVREAQVLIGIIGHYRGEEPPGDNAKRSYTEMEYDWALEAGIPRLLYVVPDHVPLGRDLPMPDGAPERQQAFRNRVLADPDATHSGRFQSEDFHTPADLAGLIITDLTDEWGQRLIEAIREQGAEAVIGPPSDAPDAGAPATPDPAAALASFAAEDGLDALLADPKDFDIAKLEAAASARAERSLGEGRAEIASGETKLKAAAKDYRRLAALFFGVDAAKTYSYYAKAAQADPRDGTTLYWLAHTARDLGRIREALAVVAPAVDHLDDSDDPQGAFWAFAGLGDLHVAAGVLPAAQEAFETARAIMENAVRLAPQNAGWQRDLSVSHDRIGDVLSAQGNLKDALQAFQASRDIAERLAQADPQNAGWQADLAASYGQLGQVHRALGDTAEARQYWEKGRAIVAPLAESSGHQLWRGYVASFDGVLAELDAEA